MTGVRHRRLEVRKTSKPRRIRKADRNEELTYDFLSLC